MSNEVGRLRRIELLLCTLDDYLSPFSDPKCSKHSGGEGAGPERKIPCPTCEGIGRTKGSSRCGMCWHGSSTADHACDECSTCQGKGKVWWNSNVKEVVGEPPERKQPEGRAGFKAKRHVEPRGFEHVIHVIESQRKLRDNSGSYQALEEALRRLRSKDEVSWAYINAVYIQQRYGWPIGRFTAPDTAFALCLARGLLFLDNEMPGHLPGHIFCPTELLIRETDSNSVNGKGRRARQRVARRRAA